MSSDKVFKRVPTSSLRDNERAMWNDLPPNVHAEWLENELTQNTIKYKQANVIRGELASLKENRSVYEKNANVLFLSTIAKAQTNNNSAFEDARRCVADSNDRMNQLVADTTKAPVNKP